MAKITYVDNEDWIGIYVDGRLAYEGHSIASLELLRICRVNYETFEADEEWLQEIGNFPRKLEDVVRFKIK